MHRVCGLQIRHVLVIITAITSLYSVSSHRPRRDTRGHESPVKLDYRSRSITHVPNNISRDVTELDLSHNKMVVIRTNDFERVQQLRVLILSNNSINLLEKRCFSQLKHLERLVLNDNNISYFTSDDFVGLVSLRVLTISGLPLTSYPTQFVAYTPELRVLSLSAIGDATIPAEYARLPQLEVLDFYEDHSPTKLTNITSAMFDNIRDSNITTLSFRSIPNLTAIIAGAFSNLPSVRSLILACNSKLPFRETVISLAITSNTSITTVVLDGSQGKGDSSFVESDFCSPFWRNVTRLSLKKTNRGSFEYTYAGCFSQLRELNYEYNAVARYKPVNPDLARALPNIHILSEGHYDWPSPDFIDTFCYKNNFLFNADDYFPTTPPVPPMPKEEPQNDADRCNEYTFRLGYVGIPPSAEFVYSSHARMNTKRGFIGNICVNHMRLRYMNLSYNDIGDVMCSNCLMIGVSRLNTVDISHGKLQTFTWQFLHSFKYLRHFDVSYNLLGIDGEDIEHALSHMTLLEYVNLSNNQYSRISPVAFERCSRLKRLNLAHNKFEYIDLNFGNMTSLEYIDLSNNSLEQLSDAFRDKLDRQFIIRPFEVNVQSCSFVCNCDKLSFVRWIRMTSVTLTGKDRLTCLYRGRQGVRINDISLDEMEAGCDHGPSVHVIVVPVAAGIVTLLLALALVRYHRWYIKYHFILCCMKEERSEYRHDAMVLYFIHAASPVDQRGGAARISRWVSRSLLKHVEEQWGLLLYVGDRDDLGGASKMHNFVRGFRSSDKVVVCLTRDFIDDSDCMNYLATALDSSKPLSKLIFVLFDDVQPTSVPRRLRQLLLPDSPSVILRCSDIDDHEDGEADVTFWRRMRDALLYDPNQERCLGRMASLSVLASVHDNGANEWYLNGDTVEMQSSQL